MATIKPLVIVGVPTWCEAALIGGITRRIDEALEPLLNEWDLLLVNADNDSPDRTSEIFSASPTRVAKHVLKSGGRGKGRNFRRLFEFSLERNADALVSIDADLEFVATDWFRSLATPVLEDGADLVIPLYGRYWYDGNLTNNILAPLITCLTGIPIRQPIAGEFAFSPRALASYLEASWNDKTYGFGIDSFCVIQSILSGQKVTQVPLDGGKIHSWRSESEAEVQSEMEFKFEAVVGTPLELLSDLRHLPPANTTLKFPPSGAIEAPPKDYSFSHLIEAARTLYGVHGNSVTVQELLPSGGIEADGLPKIDDAIWARVLARAVRHLGTRPSGGFAPDFYASLKTLFFVRMIRKLPESRGKSVAEMDESVQDFIRLLLIELNRQRSAPDRPQDAPGSGTR